jgi:hypothetical protein
MAYSRPGRMQGPKSLLLRWARKKESQNVLQGAFRQWTAVDIRISHLRQQTCELVVFKRTRHHRPEACVGEGLAFTAQQVKLAGAKREDARDLQKSVMNKALSALQQRWNNERNCITTILSCCACVGSRLVVKLYARRPDNQLSRMVQGILACGSDRKLFQSIMYE